MQLSVPALLHTLLTPLHTHAPCSYPLKCCSHRSQPPPPLSPFQGAGASPKKRRALLQALAGSYAAAASHPAGNYFVEKCYALAVSREGRGNMRCFGLHGTKLA